MSDTVLFDHAVKLFKSKRHTFLEVVNELDGMLGASSINVRRVCAEASAYVEDFEKECFETCVEFFKQNGTKAQTWCDARRRLVSLGLHPWESEKIANRAQTLVAKENENGVNSR